MSDIKVECYCGYRGEERPVRFTLGEQVLDVVEIEDQWYGPSSRYFRLRAGDGNLYLLRHDEGIDRWSLEAFRRPPRGRSSKSIEGSI
jgi:hypothetical protein